MVRVAICDDVPVAAEVQQAFDATLDVLAGVYVCLEPRRLARAMLTALDAMASGLERPGA